MSNFCANCGQQLQAGATFCAACGTRVVTDRKPPGTAQQGLAQAGLEVQSFNAALIVGRLIGIAVGLVILWFVVGPVLGPENAFAIIAAFFVLAFGGMLAGQWATLKLLRG